MKAESVLNGAGLDNTEVDVKKRQLAVYQLMKSGWVLCCWRKSAPHNWYLEYPKTGKTTNLDMRDFDFMWVRKLRDSKERVILYWGSDSGRPVLTKYVLRKRPYRMKFVRHPRIRFIQVSGWFQSEKVWR